MKLTVVAVGKVRAPYYADAVEAYASRLRRLAAFELREVRDAKGADPARNKERDGEALLAAVPKGASLVVLDERGELIGSRALADRFERACVGGQPHWTFLIGGADGHSDAVRRAASWVWSLSPLTLPHELARVVLVEQLYRASSLRAGEPYHRD